MQVFYTHWTLPRRVPGARYVFDWPSKACELLAWALSTTLAARNVGPVRIVTDAVGAEELAWIGLPATLSVVLSDETMRPLAAYWTAGKLVTYQTMLTGGPSVHLDADVFVTRPLPQAFLASTLGVQSVEPLDEPHYAGYYLPTIRALEAAITVPSVWKHDRARPLRERPAYNMGVVVAGGWGKRALFDAAALGLSVLRQAAEEAPSLPSSNVCVTAEQYVFAAHAREMGVPVTTLLPTPASTPQGNAAAEQLGYVHLFGDAKRSPVAHARLVARAKVECPILAARILQRYPL